MTPSPGRRCAPHLSSSNAVRTMKGMPMRTLWTLALLSLTLACQQGRDPEVSQPTSPEKTPAVDVGAPTNVASKPAGPALDPAPRVTRNADGTIRLELVDRWGARFDSTYEDVTYLERALPVVSRGLTDEQNVALKRAVEAQHAK